MDLGVVPDVHPPGYQILLFLVENSLGTSETALRLPSAVAGILTVLVTYLTGKRLFSQRTALFGAAMLGVSPVHIWLSQEARPYAILIMLTAIAVYLLVCYLQRDRDSKGTGLLLIMAVNFILLEYLHYFGLLVYALTGSFLFYHAMLKKRNRILVTISLLLPVLVYIPWIPVMLTQSTGNSYIESPGVMSLVYLFIEYMGWSKILPGVFVLLLIPAVQSIIKGTLRYKSGLITLCLWILLPLLVSVGVSLLAMPVFTTRNLMVALPAVFLLQAFCIAECINSRKTGNLMGYAVLILMMVQLIFVRKHYTEPHRNQFREAACHTADNIADRDNAVILACTWNPAYFDHYFQVIESGLSTDLQAISEEDFPVVRELLLEKKPEEVWLLWGHIQPDSSLVDSISSMYFEIEYEPLTGAGVWRFGRRKS